MEKFKNHIKSIVKEMMNELTDKSAGVQEFITYIENDSKALKHIMSNFRQFKNIEDIKNYIKEADYNDWKELEAELEDYKSLNEEGSTTAGVGGYLTPKAFKKSNINENKDSFTYKGKEYKVGDTIPYQGSGYEITHIDNVMIKLKSNTTGNEIMRNYSQLKENNISLYKTINEALLNEVSYNKFKKDVSYRSKTEMLHRGIKEVKRKLQEINRIVEYTSRMKQELSEGDGVQYWNRTETQLQQVVEMVNNLNEKINKLK